MCFIFSWQHTYPHTHTHWHTPAHTKTHSVELRCRQITEMANKTIAYLEEQLTENAPFCVCVCACLSKVFCIQMFSKQVQLTHSHTHAHTQRHTCVNRVCLMWIRFVYAPCMLNMQINRNGFSTWTDLRPAPLPLCCCCCSCSPSPWAWSCLSTCWRLYRNQRSPRRHCRCVSDPFYLCCCLSSLAGSLLRWVVVYIYIYMYISVLNLSWAV